MRASPPGISYLWVWGCCSPRCPSRPDTAHTSPHMLRAQLKPGHHSWPDCTQCSGATKWLQYIKALIPSPSLLLLEFFLKQLFLLKNPGPWLWLFLTSQNGGYPYFTNWKWSIPIRKNVAPECLWVIRKEQAGLRASKRHQTSLKAPHSLLYLKLTYQMHTSYPFPWLQHLAHGTGVDQYLWVRHKQVPASWVPHSPSLHLVKFRSQEGPCTPHGNKSDWWYESTRFITILLICCFDYWCFITKC